MIHIYSNNVLIKLYEDASQMKKLGAFYPFAMIKLMVVILELERLQLKCSNMDAIGLTYLKMHINTIKIMLGVNKYIRSPRKI